MKKFSILLLIAFFALVIWANTRPTRPMDTSVQEFNGILTKVIPMENELSDFTLLVFGNDSLRGNYLSRSYPGRNCPTRTYNWLAVIKPNQQPIDQKATKNMIGQRITVGYQRSLKGEKHQWVNNYPKIFVDDIKLVNE